MDLVLGMAMNNQRIQKKYDDEDRMASIRQTCIHEKTVGKGYNRICARCYLPVILPEDLDKNGKVKK